MVEWLKDFGTSDAAVRRIALVSSDRDLERRLVEGVGRARVRGLVRRWTLEQRTPAVAGHLLACAGTDVVVLDGSTPHGMALAEAIALDQPHLTSILIAEPANKVLLAATRVGAQRVLAPSASAEELRDAFECAAATGDGRWPTGDPLPTGRIITVLSCGIGSGKTMVATNVAAGLARVAPHAVAFVTADHADRSPAALRALTEQYDYVVVDTAAGLNADTLAAAEAATDVVVVTTLDGDSGGGEQLLLRAFDRLGASTPRRFLVLNRPTAGGDVDLDRVAAAFGVPVAAVLPEGAPSGAARLSPRPPPGSDPNAALARALLDLVRLVAGVPALLDQRARFWRNAS